MRRRNALAAVASTAAVGRFAPARAAARIPLRIATLTLDVSACPYYALDRGYWKDANVTAEVMPIQSGTTLTAVLGNSVDVGFANLGTLVVAFKKGLSIVLIAPADVDVAQTPVNRLVAPKQSTVRTGQDLDGKTIAVNGLEGLPQVATQAWIDKNGGNSSTVHFVEMSFPTMLEALASNRIDAALLGEPFVTASKPFAVMIADPFAAIADRCLTGCWFAKAEWARTHRASVATFVQVMSRTAKWANAHHAESGAILAKYGRAKLAVIKAMNRATYATTFRGAEMQPIIDVYAHYGLIPTPFPVSELIFK